MIVAIHLPTEPLFTHSKTTMKSNFTYKKDVYYGTFVAIASLASLLTIIPIESIASSRSISTRKSWLSEMDYYRSAPREYKCSSVDRLRGYAVSLMEQGDVSLASQFNRFLPRTGCRKSPIVIDPSAIRSSKNPEPSAVAIATGSLGADGSCLSMTEILSIERTGHISKACGNTFIYIKAHP